MRCRCCGSEIATDDAARAAIIQHRYRRLAVVLERHDQPGPDEWSAEWKEGNIDPVVLVQSSTTGEAWVTTHATPEDVASYIDQESDLGWYARLIVDLDDGTRYETKQHTTITANHSLPAYDFGDTDAEPAG